MLLFRKLAEKIHVAPLELVSHFSYGKTRKRLLVSLPKKIVYQALCRIQLLFNVQPRIYDR